MITAIIFDFDGVILETEESEYQSWQAVYRSFGCILPFEKYVLTVGASPDNFDPLRELEVQLGHPIENPKQLEAQRSQNELALLVRQPLQPGVQAYLHGARQRGLKLGLASCSDSAWIVYHLNRLGLADTFDCVRTREDVAQLKPAPDLYLSVLSQLGIPPSQAIAIEDSPPGVTAAKNAGLFIVAVPSSFTAPLIFEEPDLFLNSLADISLDQMLLLANNHSRR